MSYGNVLHRFLRAAEAHGPALAVECAEARLTYAELDERSGRLARRLAALGAPAGAPVAVLGENTAQTVVAMLAVFRAGCAFVPLSPGLPRARLEAIFEVARPGWLVAGEGLLGHVEEVFPSVPRIVAVDPAGRLGDGGAGDDGAALERAPGGPDDMAYVYFTSGSTGRPKGIAGRHKGLDHFVDWEIRTLGLGPGTRVSQLTTPTHDPFLRDVWVPLCAGGTVCAPAQDTVLDARALVDWIDAAGLNVVHCIPSLFRLLVDGGIAPGRFAALRWVLLAGEPLLPADVRRWTEVFGERIGLVNLYGPTETTLAKFAHFVRADDALRRTVPIGKPIEGAAAVVLDARGKPAPRGTVGEIYIRTPYRSLGYLGDPARTAEVFVANPLSGRADDVVYRTGDFGRVLDDGSFEFAGRRDQQVKIRGIRVELAEVEGALRSHPAVRDVAVADREHADGTRYLCAWVVVEGEPDPEALRAFAAAALSDELVPSAFVTLPALPRTATGKVDRAALPAPGGAGDARAFVAPRTSAEEALAAIWREVLEVERVGAHDNFFQLGGHSLLATRVVARVRDAFGVELPLRALFEAPTVAAFAERVERHSGTGDGGARPIPRAPRDRPLPLSFGQQRLWFIHQLDPASPSYNLPRAIRLRGPLDDGALERTVAEVVRRHEVLRTTFRLTDDGRPVQVVESDGAFALARVSLEGVEGAAREARVRRVAAEEAERPFDLARGPLVRGTLVRLDEADHVLLLTLHHIAGDAWSMDVLAREATALYGAFSGGLPSPLPPLPLQYADYAVWQRGWLQGDALERELAYWRERLAGAPELLELPTDRPRPAVASRRGASRGFRVGAGLAGALQALAQREGCTLFMVLLAGWQALLGRYAGQDDVVVGTTVANRTRREVEELVGPFLNVLALRGELAGDPTFRELLARVRQSTLGAFEHQAVPFDKVVEAVRPGRTLSHEPVFQVLFELHSGGRSGAFAEEPEGERAPVPEPAADAEAEAAAAMYDLTLTLFEHRSGVAGGLQYATDLFDRETAARMLEHYRALLESAVADPDARLSELGLIGDEERRLVVAEWNATEHAYPHACIHELFEAQVRRSPDAVAVVFGGDTLTYAELDARANRLARRLRGRGIGPEDRVGLCLERSFDLMAAFFGILKAGAAYLPLDPSHPAERLGYMLADGGARLLLTQSWLAGRLPAERPETIFLDQVGEAIARESADPVESGVRPENLAYVYYTSGSTGRPKGVAMHHYGPANYFAWGTEAYRAGDGHGAPVFSSMAVDLTLANFIPLFAGERVELLPEGMGVETLAEAVRRSPGFAMIKITPSHLTLLNQGLAADEAAASTRTLVIGADNLLAEPTLFWQDHAPGVRLLNEYGPTETVVGCSLYELGAGKHREGRIPIGRPIWNLTMYVLDAHLRPAPVGLPGELYIGGVGVARGYLGRPALTAEKFVPDPFASAAGARLYRTGDRARFLADGNLEFLGRIDFQVKIRGYRIEIGEIESLLSAHPSVREALVMAREDAPGDRRLAAYVVAEAGTTPVELRAALAEKLPDYMVPSAFVFLDEFPVGSTGKVDRRLLPAPAAEAREGDGYAAPETEAERALVEVWEEVLAVKPVGVDDDFFALGGHSMLAVRLMSQLRRRLGAELPLSALFERPTVRRLAELLDGAPGRPAWSPLVAIQPAGDRIPIFFVHPIGGQVLCYAELARALGPDQPFYGLQAPDLTSIGEAETSLEEMAASYVEAVRGVWPRGPYLLGGWSFGGLVAFEMAQQLARAGEEVPLVAMLDTAAPKHARDVATVDEAELLAVLAHEEALQAGRRLSLTVDELRPLDREARVARALDALRQAGVAAAAEVDAEWVHRLLAGHRSRREAMVRYAPEVYPGQLALFLPSEAMTGFESRRGWSDPDAWRPYTTAPLLVQPVPGHHATMGSGRSAEVLAKRLRAAIDEALSS